jgi:hypothetical protein
MALITDCSIRRAGLAVALSLLLAGCPIFDDDCSSSSDCASGFRCDESFRRCQPIDTGGSACQRPADCAGGETCAPTFECRPGSCDFYGCVRGYRCGLDQGTFACLADLDTGDAGDADASDASGPESGAGGGGAGDVDSGNGLPDGSPAQDAAPAVDASLDPSGSDSGSAPAPDAATDGG